MRRLLLMVAIPAFTLAASRPQLGTKFHSLSAGDMKAAVETSCLRCHAADILVQQRLTEKQWTAAVDKMIRWGAVVKESDKAPMIAYLSKHFGPDNKFTPITTRPVRKSSGGR